MSFQPTPLWDPVEVTPPWGWNPAATFLTAYTSMQENKREQQDMQMAAELQRILLPAKAAEAEYNLKKFTLDAQLLEKIHKTKSASLDAAYSGITSAVGGSRGSGGSGASSNVARNGGSSNQAPSQDEDPTSFNLTGTSYDRKPAAQSQPKPGSQPIAKKPVVDLTGV